MLYPPVVEREQFSPLIHSRLSDAYYRWFEVIPANTPALREKAYRLRYQVYCCENQYEAPDEHPEQLETDDFDCRSMHSLIIDRTGGAAIGTVRLILAEPESREASLPIQQICHHPLPIELPRSRAAEISRFAVSKKMRKMADGTLPKDMKCLVVVGLMRAIVQMCLEHGITDCFAVMEPSLLRLLCRFGMYFAPLGLPVEYHGVRQPCHANVAKMLDAIGQKHLDLWEFMTEPGIPRNARKVS
jgi:N-acyl amino acid synthase of PEP-CTERM/exosortase system